MKFIATLMSLAAVSAVKITHCTYSDNDCNTGKACTNTEVEFNICAADPITNQGVKSYKNADGELCTASYAALDCSGSPIPGSVDCFKNGGCYATEAGSVTFKDSAASLGLGAAVVALLVSTRM